MPRSDLVEEPGRRIGARSPVAEPLSVARLRRLWQPRRDSYARMHLYESFRIRIHRALTWLERAESMEEPAELDARFLCQMIGMRALSERWEASSAAPAAAPESMRLFLDQLLSHDQHLLIPQLLMEQRSLVQTIFADRYVDAFAWERWVRLGESPGPAGATATRGTASSRRASAAARAAAAAGRERSVAFDVRGAMAAGRWDEVLRRLMARVAFVHAQLEHGGAACGSRQNRAAVRRASLMLEHLAPVALQVMIDHGYGDEWGEPCFMPPAR